MALFENYERREAKILATLKEYGINSIEECREITLAKGVRYLEMAEGYVTRMALDENDQVIGYEFVNLGKMTDFIKKGDDPTTAYNKSMGNYGRFAPEDGAVKYIDPRKD